jgi:hypothetical protein
LSHPLTGAESRRVAREDGAIPWPTALSLGFALGLGAILGLAFLVAGGLRFEPVKDEVHFLATSQALTRTLPPSLEALRSYEEVITPAAFLFWGLLDRLTGDGAFAGRLCNLLLAGAIVCGVALRRGRPSPPRVLAAVGLISFPYLLPLGTHLYTDVPATFVASLGVRAHLRGRPVLGALLCCLAIATRQYIVAVPVALAAWEWTRALRGEADRWRAGAAAALAATSLLGWFAFFGGLAPPAGIERWLTKYPAPMQHAGDFLVSYGLYFLAALGCYLVLPELVLFRYRIPWRSLPTRRNAAIALVLALLFLFFPPDFDDWNGGAVDRFWQLVLPPGPGTLPRVVLYYGLALLTCLRFGQRPDLAFWLVAVHFVLLMKTQLPWDKYYLPVIVLLWFLKAEGLLRDPDARPERAPALGGEPAGAGAPRPAAR